MFFLMLASASVAFLGDHGALAMHGNSRIESIGCFEPGQCSESFVLTSASVENAEGCLDFCRDTPACRFWSFLPEEEKGTCYAYSECNVFITRCGDCVSGDAKCEGLDPDCFQSGFCSGTAAGDGGGTADSVESCGRLCLRDPSCQWASYRSTDDVCFLSQNCPGTTSCSGCTFSPRECFEGDGAFIREITRDLGDQPDDDRQRFVVECRGPCRSIDLRLTSSRGDPDLYLELNEPETADICESSDTRNQCFCFSRNGSGADVCDDISTEEDRFYVKVHAFDPYQGGVLSVRGPISNLANVLDYEFGDGTPAIN